MAAINSVSKIFNFPTITQGGSGDAPDPPLTLTVSNGVGTFTPGVVNGLIPSNYLSLNGISMTGTVYIGLDVTLSNAAVQTASFAVSSSPPPAFTTSKGVPPTSLTILTHVVIDGSPIRVIGTGNPWLTPSAIFETDKTGVISPGQKSTDIWYTYILSSQA